MWFTVASDFAARPRGSPSRRARGPPCQTPTGRTFLQARQRTAQAAAEDLAARKKGNLLFICDVRTANPHFQDMEQQEESAKV